MGVIDHCLLVIWRTQPTPDAFRFRNTALAAVVAKYPTRAALVEVVEANSTPPQDDARRVAMSVYKDLGDDLTAIAMLIEGSYIRSTLVRAILTTMMFFVKQLQPTKVFRSVSDTAEWIGPAVRAGSGFEQRLNRAITELRAQIKPR
ncbi:MAG: hypothetical protein ABI591_28830 [Kofleriaceae bacterium]